MVDASRFERRGEWDLGQMADVVSEERVVSHFAGAAALVTVHGAPRWRREILEEGRAGLGVRNDTSTSIRVEGVTLRPQPLPVGCVS
jgi:hypothetical protein